MTQGEKILPHPDTLNNVEYGRFVLANLAAKRAKQIREGAPPLVRIDSGHPLSIALAEIAAGKIKPILATEGAEPMDTEDLVALETLDISDMGLLLPAVEEDLNLAAVGLEDDLSDDDEDTVAEDEIVLASLGDLLEEEPEEEASATDDTEISLDDLADQEDAESDENEEES